MTDRTTTAWLKMIKHNLEHQLDQKEWRWSLRDSRVLDWCVENLDDRERDEHDG